MSRTALEVKASRKPKFSSRAYNRCPICGRPRAGRSLVRIRGRSLTWFPASGEGRILFRDTFFTRPVSFLLQILLASRCQMGYLPLRAVRRTMPESPVEPAMRRGSHRRRAGLLQWSSPVFIHGAAIRCLVPRMQAGMPRQDRRRHDSGTPWKERIFRPRAKKTLLFAPVWDMDFRLCAGSGGMGPLTPHETNLRSYRC